MTQSTLNIQTKDISSKLTVEEFNSVVNTINGNVTASVEKIETLEPTPTKLEFYWRTFYMADVPAGWRCS